MFYVALVNATRGEDKVECNEFTYTNVELNEQYLLLHLTFFFKALANVSL